MTHWRKQIIDGTRRRKPKQAITSDGKIITIEQVESEIKRSAVATAERFGYKVFSTSTNRKSRNTKGTADTFTTKDGWGNLWIAVDFKSKSGKLSEEQEELQRSGHLHIARSTAEFLTILENQSRRTNHRSKNTSQ